LQLRNTREPTGEICFAKNKNVDRRAIRKFANIGTLAIPLLELMSALFQQDARSDDFCDAIGTYIELRGNINSAPPLNSAQTDNRCVAFVLRFVANLHSGIAQGSVVIAQCTQMYYRADLSRFPTASASTRLVSSSWMLHSVTLR
jgi:hypothetical protein